MIKGGCNQMTKWILQKIFGLWPKMYDTDKPYPLIMY